MHCQNYLFREKLPKIFIFSLWEGKVATRKITNPWMATTLQIILSNYSKTEVHNAEEFGLFYLALPKKILHLKDKICTRGKNSKIRLTGLATANTYGDILPILVTGKSNTPRCFKHVKNYLVVIEHRKHVMDSQLFKEWVRELERKWEGHNDHW